MPNKNKIRTKVKKNLKDSKVKFSATKSENRNWVLILFMVIGLGLIASGLYIYKNTKDFLDTAVTAEGLVVDLVKSVNEGPIGAPIVVYQDASGRLATYRSSLSSSSPSFVRGDKVKILYNPNEELHEQTALIDDFTHIWFTSIFLIVFGSFFALFAIIFSFPFTGSKRPKEEEQEPTRKVYGKPSSF